MAKNESRKARLVEYLARIHPQVITPAGCSEIARELAPVSESYLRDLLRDCGVPLHPLVAGVRQDSFESLEQSLRELLAEYESGSAETRRLCRDLVIRAKDHARFAMAKKRSDAKRSGAEPTAVSHDKEEMALWMLTWLENPSAFPVWLGLRKRRLQA